MSDIINETILEEKTVAKIVWPNFEIFIFWYIKIRKDNNIKETNKMFNGISENKTGEITGKNVIKTKISIR